MASVAVNELGLRVGESHPNARYTNEQVDQVLGLRDDGQSYGQIVRETGIPKSTVACICKGLRRCQTPARWKTIEE